MGKIYIKPEERGKYESRGIPVHVGPRGGLYILSEDLKRAGVSYSEELGHHELVRQYVDRLLDWADEVRFEDNEAVLRKGEEEVRISKDRIVVNSSWKVESDDPVVIAVGAKVLGEAMSILGKEVELPVSREELKMTVMPEDLEQALVIVSAKYAQIDDLDWVESIDDLKEALLPMFGPWIYGNVIKVEGEDVPVVSDEMRSAQYWRDILDMVVFGIQFRMFTINFVSHDRVRQFGKPLADAITVMGSDVYLPVDMSDSKYPRWVAWHEFQHVLYDMVESTSVEFWAYHMAMEGKLTEYAKTDGNEALSEFWAMYMTGKLPHQGEYKELFEKYLDILKEWH